MAANDFEERQRQQSWQQSEQQSEPQQREQREHFPPQKEKTTDKLIRMAEKTGDTADRLAKTFLGGKKKPSSTTKITTKPSGFEYGYETELHQEMLSYVRGRQGVNFPGISFLTGKGAHGQEENMNFITGRGPSSFQADMNFITGRGPTGMERD